MKRKKNVHIPIVFFITVFGILAITGVGTLLSGFSADIEKETAKKDEFLSETVPAFSSEQAIPNSVFVGYTAPVCGIITSGFGERTDPFSRQTSFHRGIDIAVAEGSEVSAAATGIVKESAFHSVGGNYIILDHGDGQESYYGHLQTRFVSKGDEVQHGQIIGRSGATGMVTGPHLHFQMIYCGTPVNPLDYITVPYENAY